MRKLFVLFLLVSLVPFTVGCNGLWDFDDDDDVYTAPTSVKAIVPAALAPNLRAALDKFANQTITINGVTLPATNELLVGTNYEVTYSAVLSSTQIAAMRTGVANVSITTPSGTITGSINFTGTTTTDSLTITVTGTSISGVTVGTTALPGTAIGSTSFAVTSVTTSGTQLTSEQTSAVSVATLNPTFRVNFGTAPVITNAEWTVKVTNVTSGNYFTLSSTSDSALFTPTAVGTAVDVKVGSASGKALKAGQTYKVEIMNLKTSDGKLLNPATYYFKTAATTFTTTTLTDYTGKAANITVATPQVITLTFSANVAAQPTGTVKLIRYADSARTTKEAELTIDATTATYAYGATNNIVTVTFNQPFVSGKFYTVQNLTGMWLDTNGNAVEGVSSIDFATN